MLDIGDIENLNILQGFIFQNFFQFDGQDQ